MFESLRLEILTKPKRDRNVGMYAFLLVSGFGEATKLKYSSWTPYRDWWLELTASGALLAKRVDTFCLLEYKCIY